MHLALLLLPLFFLFFEKLISLLIQHAHLLLPQLRQLLLVHLVLLHELIEDRKLAFDVRELLLEDLGGLIHTPVDRV